ncbi:MAG: phosphotransferase [Actinomycetota bacterium]
MEPGRLIASGRDGDIFEFGPGRVLRRTKTGRVIEQEARIMTYLAEQGYPVPAIYEVRADGTEIVMERIEGPMMMDTMARRPWTIPKGARVLADLAERLAMIPAPAWLRRHEPGDTLLHLDLHPMNVMMAPTGPVVIDWPNAAVGDRLTDPALAYVLLTCPRVPAPWIVRTALQPMRRLLARQFARRWWGPELFAAIARCADWKAGDANMFPDESAKCRRLAVRMRAKQGRTRTREAG